MDETDVDGVSYSRQQRALVSTEEFDEWLRQLKDRRARLRILARIDRLAHGHPGDVGPVGRGVSELRLTFGPGFRIYHVVDGERLVILLLGGTKATQARDIRRAHRLAAIWRSRKDQP